MTAILSALLAMLPHIALKLIMPFLSEDMMTKIAQKALGSALKKMASLTETTSDDEAVQFILDVWEKNK